MNQLKEDLRNYFLNDDIFQDVTIKGAYDEIPIVKYPLISILEVINQDNQQYDTVEGENISDLGYQFDAECGNMQNMLAPDAAILLSRKIDDFIRTYENGRYNAMRRTGRSAILPLINDSTKIKSSTTYTCSLDIKNHIIYKNS